MYEYEIVKHQKIRGLSIFLNAVDYRRAHEHSEWELIWVLENRLVVTCDNSQTVLNPGQMVLFSPYELHELRTQGDACVFLCMQISPSVLPIQPNQSLLERFPQNILPEDDFLRVKERLYRTACNFFLGRPRYELFCLGESILALGELLAQMPLRDRTPAEIVAIKERNARIERMMKFVEENYMRRIRLADLAEREGCSVSYLSRLIKSYTNQTFQEYVEYVRFLNACVMIASGRMKMLDVCVDCGFSDYRYFTRAFRQYLGMTPEEYARRGQSANSSANIAHAPYPGEHIFTSEESLSYLMKFETE